MTVAMKRGFWNWFKDKEKESEEITFTDEERKEYINYIQSSGAENYGRHLEITKTEDSDAEAEGVSYVSRLKDLFTSAEAKVRFGQATIAGMSFAGAFMPPIIKVLSGYFHDLADDLTSTILGPNIYDIPQSLPVHLDNYNDVNIYFNGVVDEHDVSGSVSGDFDGQLQAHNLNGDMNGLISGQIGEADTNGNINADVVLEIRDGKMNGIVEGTTFDGTYSGGSTDASFTGTITTDYGQQGQVISDVQLDGTFNEDGTFTGNVGDMKVTNAVLEGRVSGNLANGVYDGKIEAHDARFNYYGTFKGRVDAVDFDGDISGQFRGTASEATFSGNGNGSVAGESEGFAEAPPKTPYISAGFAALGTYLSARLWRGSSTKKEERRTIKKISQDATEHLKEKIPHYKWRISKSDILTLSEKVQSIDYTLETGLLPGWIKEEYKLKDYHLGPIAEHLRSNADKDSAEERKKKLESIHAVHDALTKVKTEKSKTQV